MMRRKYAQFIEFKPNRIISCEEDGEFLVLLKNSLLLSLKEAGILTDAQYQIAVEVLNRNEGTQGRKRGR